MTGPCWQAEACRILPLNVAQMLMLMSCVEKQCREHHLERILGTAEQLFIVSKLMQGTIRLDCQVLFVRSCWMSVAEVHKCNVGALHILVQCDEQRLTRSATHKRNA